MIVQLINQNFEVNTSEAYNKDVFVINDILIIPFINLEIFSNTEDSNNFKIYDKIDFSYLIFKGVADFKCICNSHNYDRRFFQKSKNDEFLLSGYVGIRNLLDFESQCEVEVLYKEQLLILSEDYKAKNGPLSNWIPIATVAFKQNLDNRVVDQFFSIESIPEELRIFLEIKDTEVISILKI